MSQFRTFAAGRCHHQGRRIPCREDVYVASRTRGFTPVCTRGFTPVCSLVGPTGLDSPGNACVWEDRHTEAKSYGAACVGHADGWGVRARVVAQQLTI
ncbi:MAG: hypothetical protein J6X16_09500 [Bacteroidales bacterium]|nr:hypothetical protein [Bacteroidales bacterium]